MRFEGIAPLPATMFQFFQHASVRDHSRYRFSSSIVILLIVDSGLAKNSVENLLGIGAVRNPLFDQVVITNGFR